MRTVLVAALSGLAMAVLYTTFLAPGPSEPATSETELEILRRLEGLERDLALRESEESARLQGRADAAELRFSALEARLQPLLKRVEEMEPRLEAVEEVARARPTATPPSPEAVEANRLEVDRWIEKLGSDDENIAFSSTLELARLKDKRAVPALINVLQTHRDFYVRLGGATALGDIRAVDAVPALIDALNDKDALVRTAANDALHAITGQTFEFKSEMDQRDRLDLIDEWHAWWRKNEDLVRKR